MYCLRIEKAFFWLSCISIYNLKTSNNFKIQCIPGFQVSMCPKNKGQQFFTWQNVNPEKIIIKSIYDINLKFKETQRYCTLYSFPVRKMRQGETTGINSALTVEQPKQPPRLLAPSWSGVLLLYCPTLYRAETFKLSSISPFCGHR